jgi:hypothetical protein
MTRYVAFQFESYLATLDKNNPLEAERIAELRQLGLHVAEFDVTIDEYMRIKANEDVAVNGDELIISDEPGSLLPPEAEI